MDGGATLQGSRWEWRGGGGGEGAGGAGDLGKKDRRDVTNDTQALHCSVFASTLKTYTVVYLH